MQNNVCYVVRKRIKINYDRDENNIVLLLIKIFVYILRLDLPVLAGGMHVPSRGAGGPAHAERGVGAAGGAPLLPARQGHRREGSQAPGHAHLRVCCWLAG